MKKTFLKISLIGALLFSLNSCYVHQYNVGKGAETNETVKKKNHYLIGGLVGLDRSNPQEMAGKENYQVTTKFTFVDMLISSLTFGIYSPTTTEVKK